MAYIGKNPDFNTGTLNPLSAQPANPTEGMIYYDDGTTNTKGVYKYQNGAWEFISSLIDFLKLNPLSADPSSPIEGQVQFADGTVRAKGLWVYQDSEWRQVGSGAGSLDIFHQEDFLVTDSADFTSGNNATIDGGGSLAGTLADETASPIAGNRSLKFTQAAGSLNDYALSPIIALEDKQQGNTAKVTFYSTYTGADSDIRFVIYDDTNNVVRGELAMQASTVPQRNEIIFSMLESTANLKFGFQVDVANNGAILLLDDVELTLNPFSTRNVQDVQTVRYHTGAGFGSTANKVPYFSTVQTSSGSGLFTVDNDSTNGFRVTAQKPCTVLMSWSGATSSGQPMGIASGDPTVDGATGITSLASSKQLALNEAAGGAFVNPTVEVKMDAGDIIYPTSRDGGTVSGSGSWSVNVVATEESLHVITPAKSNINSYSARVNNNGTASISTESITGWLDSVNRTSTGTVDYDWTSLGLTVIPTVNVSVANNAGQFAGVTSITTTGCTVQTRADDGSTIDRDVSIEINLQGTDVKNAQFIAAIPKNLTQRKYLTSDQTASGEMTDLRCENLSVGKYYKIDFFIRTDRTTSVDNGKSVQVDFENNSTVIKEFYDEVENVVDRNFGQTFNFTFKAAASSLIVRVPSGGLNRTQIYGNGTDLETHLDITELNYTEETDRF